MKSLTTSRVVLGFCATVGLSSCLPDDGRSQYWERPVDRVHAFGLLDAVAVSDPDADRVVLLTTDADRNMTKTAVATQRGVRTVQAAPDRSKLFVVSEGDGDARPPHGKPAQTAALEIVTRGEATATRYPLSEPLAGLALDPRGQWAVLYADQTSASLVRNPNELLLVDLTAPPTPGANPHPHTLRSFGGQPQRFTFTEELQLPGGPRRLLIVETEQDVAVIDLLKPDDPEITIQLTSGQDTRQLHPAGIAVSDGETADVNDARIAIRLDNDSTVLLAQFVPGQGRDFRPDLNLTDVGGVPSDAAFVRTDGGALALAVLVPSRSKAVLIDPLTSLTTDVALPSPYQRLSLVTGQAQMPATPGAALVDVALLWNGGLGSVGGVSFWELGRTAGRPYRSVETVGVTAGVTNVQDVDGAHPELKILGTSVASFFLLDLKARTSSPFVTSTTGVRIAPAATGERAWAFLPGREELSAIDLVNLHPERMRIDRPISEVFEIAAVEGVQPGAGTGTGARSLVVWHQGGNGGATIYDAQATGSGAAIDDRRNQTAILTEDLHVESR